MKNIDIQIINSIKQYTSSPENAQSAIIHWRWSQFERKRRAVIRREFKGLAITNTEEYSVLVFISHTVNPSAHEITDYLSMERSTVSEFIKRCVRRDLICELQSTTDKRKKTYHLTPLGEQTIVKAHERMERVSASLFSSLAHEEQKSLLILLGQL